MSQAFSSPIKVVFAGGYEGSTSYPVHRHENAWELIYVRAGEIQEVVEDERFDLEKGMFVVHPPGSVHGDIATDDYALFHVLIEATEPLSWPKFGRDLEGEPIGAILSLIVDNWYNGLPRRDSLLRHTLSVLDIYMTRCGELDHDSSEMWKVVTEARGLFRKNFHRKIDMGAVARDLGVSRSTLYAHFERVLDRTPQAVLGDIRLRHAVFLLKHSKLPVDSVACESGFCSSSHLNRRLRQRFMASATEIRRALERDES